MEIDYRMNVHVPFEFCGKCKKFEPTTETLFLTDGEPYTRRNYCEHAGICKNAVELMTSEKGRTHQPQKEGKWIPVGELDGNGNQSYECSVCHSGELHAPSVKVSYCWNCGAKMEEEK